MPGDPAQMMLGQNEDSEQLTLIKKKYGFDKPVFIQYLYYLNDLSPVSIHFNESQNLSFLKKDKYNYVGLLSFEKYKVVLKTPYLRESYQKNGVTVVEIIKNTFPMGSMTGAPKVSAMKLIEAYELTKRGLYSGALGYIKPNGDFDFNVVIMFYAFLVKML